jgi:hypothetical protein
MRGEIIDRYGAVLRVFHRDAQDPNGKFVIETRENIDMVQAQVDRLREIRASKEGRLKDMRHIAEIPMSIVEKAMREGWLNDRAAWKKFLNDPDNKGLRVQGGRV